MSERPKKYSKRRLAEIQIIRAIKVLVEDRDPVSAVTLAGAAEEILGKKLNGLGRRNAFDLAVGQDIQQWAFIGEIAKKKSIPIAIPSEEAIAKGANRVRNELKHQGGGRPVAALFPYEAENMIIRAVNNYFLLYQKPPPQKYVIKWCENLAL